MKFNSDHSPKANNTLLPHLLELRHRLLRVTVVILGLFASLFYFSHDLYHLLAEPLLKHLPNGNSLIATGITTAFFTPLKLSFICAILLAVPVLLYEFWGFLAPALYTRERQLVLPLLLLSTGLFFAGMAFAYFVVFPLVFAFLVNYMPQGIQMMPDMALYLDFALKLFFAFGVAFEVPILVLVLVWTGISTPTRLARQRPYVVILAFVLGMLLTPPDMISQILLAVPLWLLFEAGLLAARFLPEKLD